MQVNTVNNNSIVNTVNSIKMERAFLGSCELAICISLNSNTGVIRAHSCRQLCLAREHIAKFYFNMFALLFQKHRLIKSIYIYG